MKLTKKKVFVIALAICLIAILSFSTLAWFNSTDEVKNEFFVATNEDTTADDIFSVDVWEPDDKNGDGVITDDEKEHEGLEFKDIVPGGTYHKEPTIENTGYYDQWVRVIVTVTDATAWTNILGDGYDLENIFEGFNSKWVRYAAPSKGSNDTLIYVFYYNDVLDGADPDEAGESTTGSAVLFTGVKFPENLTQEDMVKLAGGFDLKIKADAIQVDALEADNARDAFAEVRWTAGSTYEDAMNKQ